jgi:cellulose synthase/poly-beta-1,6-N-acetylglucosamine synthase-like glycosyltransferase
MEKKNKSLAYVICLLVVGFVVLNIIDFVCAPEYDAVFWISYVFMTIAFVCNGVLAFVQSRGNRLKNYFYMASAYSFATAYVIIQAIFSMVCSLTGIFTVKPVVLIDCIILGIYIILSLFVFLQKNEVKQAKENVRVKKNFINTATVMLNEIASMTADRKIKKIIEKNIDEIKYSIPKDNEALDDIEMNVYTQISVLKEKVSANDVASIASQSEAVNVLIRQRNDKCRGIK